MLITPLNGLARVLAYAAINFKTNVMNNIWVLLCTHIKCLLKAYIYQLKESKSMPADFSPFLAWTATSNEDSVIIITLPPLIRDYVFYMH